jgi:hypothetical protein
MAISEWPDDIVPYAQSFYLQPHTGGSESPFSRVTKVYGLAAPRWVTRIALRAAWNADRFGGTMAEWGERIDALIASLKGRQEPIRLWDFRRPGESKAFTNAAASQGDTAITFVGAAPTEIRVGQYFGGDGRPHIVTALAVSGSDLVATFEPPLMGDLAAGQATFEKVSGLFRLTSDDAGDNMTNVEELTEYTLEFTEDASAPVSFELPAVFNNQLGVKVFWNGSTITFDRNPYDVIDVVGSGADATHYYVDYQSGSDSNAGTSAASAFQTWEKVVTAVAALSAGSKVVIHLLDDAVGLLSSFTRIYTQFDGRHVKVKGEGQSGFTKFLDMRESWDQAAFAWVAHGSGAWKSNAASVGPYSLQFYLPTPNTRIGVPIVSTGQTATSVGTTELTSYWDSGTSTLYVHLPGGAKPDPFTNWEYSINTAGLTLRADSGTLLLENIGFGPDFGNLSTRSVTDSDFTSQARLGLRGCFSYGATTATFAFKDFQIICPDQCVSAYSKTDHFNYHTNQTTGTHGEFMTVYETGCTASEGGYTGFADGFSTGTSCNGSTAHDSIHVLRANGAYDGMNGAVVADVNGVVSVNLNVQPAHPGSGAIPKALYWHSGNGYGSHYGMYLAYCRGNDDGDASVILLDSSGTDNAEADGQIYVQKWRGQTDGTVVGTLKDWDGNVLASLAEAV